MNNFISSELDKSLSLFQALKSNAELAGTIEAIGAKGAEVVRNGGRILFAGNGGSAADAQHLAAELVGKLVYPRPAMPAIALTTDTSILTAVGNDFGYEQVFARQLEALGRRGDMLVAISTSGRSPNVVKAIETARDLGISTVGMTGGSGGDMAALVDYCVCIPSDETAKIQEGHITLGHIFCSLIERQIHPREA